MLNKVLLQKAEYLTQKESLKASHKTYLLVDLMKL